MKKLSTILLLLISCTARASEIVNIEKQVSLGTNKILPETLENLIAQYAESHIDGYAMVLSYEHVLPFYIMGLEGGLPAYRSRWPDIEGVTKKTDLIKIWVSSYPSKPNGDPMPWSHSRHFDTTLEPKGVMKQFPDFFPLSLFKNAREGDKVFIRFHGAAMWLTCTNLNHNQYTTIKEQRLNFEKTVDCAVNLTPYRFEKDKREHEKYKEKIGRRKTHKEELITFKQPKYQPELENSRCLVQ